MAANNCYDLNISPPENAATVLCYAVRCGNEAVLNLLLELGADPNFSNENCLNPLMEATKLSDTKCKLLNLLIGKGADLNKALSDNQTALHFAVHCGNFEAVKALLKSDANTSIGMADAAYGAEGKNLFTPLYSAVLYGHREIVLALLEAGADTNIGIAKEHWSQNLLVRAVYNNKKWLAELLLKYGASAEATYLSSTQKAALTALLAKKHSFGSS